MMYKNSQLALAVGAALVASSAYAVAGGYAEQAV